MKIVKLQISEKNTFSANVFGGIRSYLKISYPLSLPVSEFWCFLVLVLHSSCLRRGSMFNKHLVIFTGHMPLNDEVLTSSQTRTFLHWSVIILVILHFGFCNLSHVLPDGSLSLSLSSLGYEFSDDRKND